MPSTYQKILHSDLPAAANPGITEESVRSSSGLRTDEMRIRTVQDINYLTGLGSTPTGAFCVLSNNTDWTRVTETATSELLPVASNRVLPYPCTPVFKVQLIDVPVVYPGGQLRLRVTGYDQFGNGIVEVTPWLFLTAQANTTANEGNHYGCLSKVFSEVTMIEYQASGLTALNINAFSMGPFFWPNPVLTLPGTGGTWIESVATNEDLGSYWNMGFGTTRRCRSLTLDPTGVTKLETALAAGTTMGKGDRDCLSGYIRNETASLEGPFGKPVKDGARIMGGFLIGQNDPFAQWQGCRDKIHVAWVPASIEIFDLPISAGIVVTTASTNIYDVRFHLRTTIGKSSAVSDYPVLSRP